MKLIIGTVIICSVWLVVWIYLFFYSFKIWRGTATFTAIAENSVDAMVFSAKAIVFNIVMIIIGVVCLLHGAYP